jgi:arsenite-transporting ATPase
VERQFAPVPVRTVPYFDREMLGIDGLGELGDALFGGDDPTAFFYRGRPYQVRTANGATFLDVALPFTSKEEVGLSRDGDELVLQVGSWRRTLVLPRALIDVPTKGAKMNDGVLRIEFQPRTRSTARGGTR